MVPPTSGRSHNARSGNHSPNHSSGPSIVNAMRSVWPAAPAGAHQTTSIVPGVGAVTAVDVHASGAAVADVVGIGVGSDGPPTLEP